MSAIDGLISVSRTSREIDTKPHAFIHVDVHTPNGILRVTVDAGWFSEALAHPGRIVGATLENITSASKGAA